MNIQESQQKVREFMLTVGQDCPEKLTMPDADILFLRCELMLEELREYMGAVGLMIGKPKFANDVPIVADPDNNGPNMVEAVDAIADLLYVTLGTAVAMGVDIQPVFNEVHRSNMSKLWRVEDLEGHHHEFARVRYTLDGRAICYNKSGKVIKSPSYSKADIAGVLRKQGWGVGK